MTRDAVKQVAKELFQHYTYDKTTVMDIAREAGVGKGLIYLWFKNKDGILKAIEEDRLSALDAQVASWAHEGSLGPEDRIPELFGLVIDEYFQLKRLLFSALDMFDSPLGKHPIGFFEVYRPWLLASLRKLMPNSPPLPDLGSDGNALDRVSLYADLLFSYFFQGTVNWSRDPDEIRRRSVPVARVLLQRLVTT